MDDTLVTETSIENLSLKTKGSRVIENNDEIFI
jgi:hypothetical protein